MFDQPSPNNGLEKMVDKDKIIESYNEDGASSISVAKKLGISKTTVLKCLRSNNIPIKQANKEFHEITPKVIELLKEHTPTEVSELLSISRRTVTKVAKRNNIDVSSVASNRLIDRDAKMVELYNQKDATCVSVAKELGLHVATVESRLKKNNITIQPAHLKLQDVTIDTNELTKQVVELLEKHSTREIAKILHISRDTVRKIAKDNNIDCNAMYANRLMVRDAKMIELYNQDRASAATIAKELGITPSMVQLRLKKNNIRIKPVREIFGKLTQEQINYILSSEKSSYQLAKELGIESQTVQRILKKNGKNIGSFTDKWKERMLSGLSNCQSSLEIKFQNILESLDIKSTRQFVIEDFKYDFYVPDSNLVIEINGSYWHRTKERSNKDKIKRNLAIKNGHNYLVVWDFELIKEDCVISKIKRFTDPPIGDLIANEYKISLISNEQSNEILYWHEYGETNAEICYGLFHNDTLIGTITLNKSDSSSLELTRLCILPNRKIENLNEFFVNEVVKQFKNTKLTAFSDQTFDNTGRTFEKCGWTKESEKGYDYFYTDYKNRIFGIVNKEDVQKKAIDADITEEEMAYELRLLKVVSQPKTKWYHQT